MTQALLDIAVAAALVLAAAGLGRMLLKAIGLHDASVPAAPAFSLALGLMAAAFATLALGAAGLLYAPLFQALLIACLVLAGPGFLREYARLSPWAAVRRLLEITLLEKVLLVLTAAQTLAILLVILIPPLGSNMLAWRLAVPRMHIADHTLAGHRAWPLLGESLAIAALLVKSEVAAQLLSLAVICAAAAVTYTLARRFFIRRVAIVALAIFMLTPQLVSSVGFFAPECMMALLVPLTFLALACWLRCKPQHRLRWLILVSLLTAGVAATKPVGAVHAALVLPAVLWILVLGFRERPTAIARRLTAFAAVVSVLAGLWYVQMFSAGTVSGDQDAPTAVRRDASTRSRLCPSALVTYPWDVTMNGRKLGMLITDNPGPLPLAFIPLLLVVLRPVPRAASLMLLYTAVFTVVVFVTSATTRHLVPVFGLTSIATALAIVRMQKLGRVAATAAASALLVACVLQVGISAKAVAGDETERLKMVAGGSAEAHLQAQASVCDAFEFLNAGRPQGRVLLLYGSSLPCPRAVAGFAVIDAPLSADAYRSEDRLVSVLRSLNVDYIYVDEHAQALAQAGQVRLDPRVAELQEWLLSCCRLVYRKEAPGGQIRIYRFIDRSRERTENERL